MNAVDGENAEDEVVQRQRQRFGGVHGAALILLGGAVVAAPLAPSRWFVAVYAIAALAWLALRNVSLSLPRVLVVALVLRAFLVMPEPRLSGDVYRYLSDGRALISGVNPYAYTPTDPRINHPEIRSIYPPVAQFLFALVHEIHAWRLLIIAFDLAAIWLLRERGFAYATCPLVLFEGTWSGHLDAIASVFLLIALLRKSGLAAGVAAGLKIIPIAGVFHVIPSVSEGPGRAGGAIPRPPRAARFLATLGMTLVVPFLPFLRGPIMPGLRDYATRWIFNSPLYDVIFFIVDRIPTKTIWTHHPLRFQFLSDWVYRHVYPDFITRAIMATIAVAAILLARRASTAVAALLLCSPAIHPWYWLTLLGVSLHERTRWTWVALAAPASYLLYDGAPRIVVYLLCYAVALRRSE